MFLNNIDLWSGFYGSVIGAVVGGMIALAIVLIQLHYHKKQQKKKEKDEKLTKEVQLLWQIYFDIKKDMELSDLWQIQKENLNEGTNLIGTPVDYYLREILPTIMCDIKNLLKLLEWKENELKNSGNAELIVLWERVSNLLLYVRTVASKHSKLIRWTDTKFESYLQEAEEVYLRHLEDI